MGDRLFCALLVVGVVAAVGLRAADPAQAAQCRSVHAEGRTAYGIHAHSIGCHKARRHLHKWMRTRFPHDFTGWYCDLSARRKICSNGNGAAPPYMTFYLRRS